MKSAPLLALSFVLLAPRAALAQSSDAPSPPASPRRPAHLEVKTHVPGADVFADGQPIGMTPASPFVLPAGAHTIELRRPGYATARAEVTLAEGSSSEVTLEPEEDATSLPSMGGVLALRLTEPDVLVTVDGHLRGVYASPLRLPRGVHHLVAQRENFEPVERDFVIEPGHATTLDVALAPSSEYRAQFVSRARSQRAWGLASMIAGVVIGAVGTGLVVNDTHDEIGWPLAGAGAAGVVLGIVLFATADDPHHYDQAEGRKVGSQGLRVLPVVGPVPRGGGATLVAVF
jgi:hypothetical protein